MTALEKFRKAAAEREKKHAEIEKKQSKDGSGMTAAIDRLSKQVNKEEVEQVNEISVDSASNYIKKRTFGYVKTMKGQVQPSDVYNKMSDKHKAGINRAMDRVVKPVSEETHSPEDRGGADSYYGRPYNNPHKVGSQEHKDYHKGYHGTEFGQKDYGAPKNRMREEIIKTKTGLIHKGKYGTEYSGKTVETAKQRDAMDLTSVNKHLTKRLEKGMGVNFKKEDAPVNATGSGTIAGLGVGPQGEPGVNMKKKKKVIPFAIFTRKISN